MISADPSAPVPDGEHHPAADEAPAADGKDTADEKLDGKWRRKRYQHQFIIVDYKLHYRCVIQ